MINPRVKIWTEGFLKVGESYVRDFGTVDEDGRYAFTLEKLASSKVHRTNLFHVYNVLVRLKRILPIGELPVEKRRQIWAETLKYCKGSCKAERIKFSLSVYALSSMVEKKAPRKSKTLCQGTKAD